MKNKIILIIIIIVIILIISLLVIVVKSNTKPTITEIQPQANIEEVEEPLVVLLEEKKETVENQEEPVHVKDASELTQEIYDINGPIGNINIPKTGLNTQIYSRVTASQMEEMPCFLYTTGGLNEIGTTIFVGHNRNNGLLFSNNSMLDENDEFYFKDLNGIEKKYIVYSKFTTSNDDVSFYNLQVDSPVIVMQCCLTPTDENNVLIIMAKAEN